MKMNMLRRMLYMGLGAMLALGIAIGAFAVFAQDDQPDEEMPAPEIDLEGEDSAGAGLRQPRFRLEVRGPDAELLAEALGISVEELESARDDARAAAIEQAVAEGRLTAEQAEALLAGEGRFRPGFFVLSEHDELLAEALGISVAELQAARAEARAAMLARLVEAGVITPERADLAAAREALQGYFDQEALAETLQNAYQAAIDAALADGAITADQAEQLQENMPGFGEFEFFGRGFGGRGGPGHHGFGGLLPDSDAGASMPGDRSGA